MDMKFLEEMLMARVQRDDTKGAGTVTGEANPPAANPQQQQQQPGGTDPGDRRRRIAEAAYRRWQNRGGGDGGHERDWLDAESEVDGEERRPRP